MGKDDGDREKGDDDDDGESNKLKPEINNESDNEYENVQEMRGQETSEMIWKSNALKKPQERTWNSKPNWLTNNKRRGWFFHLQVTETLIMQICVLVCSCLVI
jgi:hypothetical protein